MELSSKIINILKLQKHSFKHTESGNLVEFLLFNDFSQYINLKECLFLLNEENYEKTNLFKFRTEYKNIITKENEEYIDKINDNQKIFSDLFFQYKSF